MTEKGSGKKSILEEMRPFFYPRSIAVVGVSEDVSKFGSALCGTIKAYGYSGRIYPVGARISEFMGLKVYPSITELPEAADLAYICLSPSNSIGAVQEAKEKGIPAAIVFAVGFSETGAEKGKKLEAELAALAGGGTRILGPNCFGVYSPAGGLTQVSGKDYARESGCLGVLSQSGGISEDICRYAQDYGLRISHAVSYGNACDITEVELLEYFEAHPETEVIAVYLEGARKGRDLFRLLKRLTPKKPVIFWKGGLTPGGAEIVASHTASLAGDQAIWEAMLRQAGALQVHSLEDLMDAASMIVHTPPQTDDRVAVISGGGGIGVAASDACYRAGLTMNRLSREVRARISSFLPPVGASAGNPIDVATPFPPAEMLKDVLETVASSGEVGSMVLEKVSPSVRLRECIGYTVQIGWEEKPWLEEIPVRILQNWKVPIIVILREGGELPNDFSLGAERRRLRRYYQEEGVAVFPTVERALRALGLTVRYYRSKQERSRMQEQL